MSESIFIFQDNETEMAVAVRDCDDERAMSMLYAALTSPMSLPIRKFDALEFATCFVAVNKRGPYDILFCGEFMEEDLEDVAHVYDCRTSEGKLVVTPMSFDQKEGCQEPQQIWALSQHTLH